MPFLTKPTVVKGEPSSFTLVKSQLILIPKVSSDTFFADTTNWQRVTVQYVNTHGQEEVLVFDASMTTPTATFSVTEKARSDYQITRIIVRDVDDGIFVIARSDLSTENLEGLDVTFQTITEGITWTQPLGVGEFITTENSVQKTGGGSDYNISLRSQEVISEGDGYVEFTINDPSISQNFVAGLAFDPRSSSGSYNGIDFGVNLTANGGELRIYQYGSPDVAIHIGSPLPNGTLVRISLEEGNVKYYLDGILKHTTVSPIINYPLYFEISMYQVGTAVYNVKLIP